MEGRNWEEGEGVVGWRQRSVMVKWLGIGGKGGRERVGDVDNREVRASGEGDMKRGAKRYDARREEI